MGYVARNEHKSDRQSREKTIFNRKAHCWGSLQDMRASANDQRGSLNENPNARGDLKNRRGGYCGNLQGLEV